jgi:hypothetical protein
MIIVQPYTCAIDRDNRYTTNAHFENGVVRKFYFRGSIAWPEGKKEGFALLAGQDLVTKHTIIFKEYPFWTIDNWLRPDGNVHQRDDGSYYLGLMQFIQDNLALYKCASYFWGGQHIEYYQRFGKEVYMNPDASRRIELIEAPYVSEIGPEVLLSKLKTQQFKGQVDSMLAKSVETFIGMQNAKVEYDNPTLALMTLLVGFDYQPWVDINNN